MYAMTYHSDNEFGAIRQADKADLMTRLRKFALIIRAIYQIKNLLTAFMTGI